LRPALTALSAAQLARTPVRETWCGCAPASVESRCAVSAPQPAPSIETDFTTMQFLGVALEACAEICRAASRVPPDSSRHDIAGSARGMQDCIRPVARIQSAGVTAERHWLAVGRDSQRVLSVIEYTGRIRDAAMDVKLIAPWRSLYLYRWPYAKSHVGIGQARP